MSTAGEEKYVDLEKLCKKIAPELFESLSWILILNLDLIPKEDIDYIPNITFSYKLMFQKYDEAFQLAQQIAQADNPISKYYKQLLELDPKLTKTREISETFFALAKRRIEISEKLGIKQV